MKKVILLFTSISCISIYSQVGINTPNPKGILHVDGSKDNPTTGVPTTGQQANDFVVTSTGSVGIGTNSPDNSAMMEINVANGPKKGFLGPRVALTSNVDATTILSPATGLLVYNLDTAGLTYKGYVFWNGTEWRTFDNKSLATGTLGSLSCAKATLSPSTYTAGTPYTGTLTVPYTDANGGVYSAQTIGPVNGLTATLAAGNFNVGSGNLTYTVSGTPTATSPSTTTFSVNIGGQSCSATVGSGTTLSQGEMSFYHKSITYSQAPSSPWLLSSIIADLPVLDGIYRVDARINGRSPFTDTGAATNYDPRLYNVSSSNVKVWVSEVSTHTGDSNTGNVLLAPGNYVQFDDGVYFSQGYNETVTFDLTTADNKWYRIYYVLRVDNKSTTGTGTGGDNLTPTNDSDVTNNTIEVYISTQRLY